MSVNHTWCGSLVKTQAIQESAGQEQVIGQINTSLAPNAMYIPLLTTQTGRKKGGTFFKVWIQAVF